LWAVGCKVRSHLRHRFFLPQNPRWPPLFLFSLSWPPPPLFPGLAAPPFSPLVGRPSPPIAANLHCFLLPRSFPTQQDREEEEHVELKRKRGSSRCSTLSLLADFLGETLGKDGIIVPPCNYVLLEVVDHGN
jgi:hypothetical protein